MCVCLRTLCDSSSTFASSPLALSRPFTFCHPFFFSLTLSSISHSLPCVVESLLTFLLDSVITFSHFHSVSTIHALPIAFTASTFSLSFVILSFSLSLHTLPTTSTILAYTCLRSWLPSNAHSNDVLIISYLILSCSFSLFKLVLPPSLYG